MINQPSSFVLVVVLELLRKSKASENEEEGRRRARKLRFCGRLQLGYQVDHQTASHAILRHPQMRRLTVPNHRQLAKGTLRAPIREAGLAKEEFVHLLCGPYRN